MTSRRLAAWDLTAAWRGEVNISQKSRVKVEPAWSENVRDSGKTAKKPAPIGVFDPRRTLIMIERPTIGTFMETPMSSPPEPADVIASKSANIMTEFGDLSTLAKASLILSDDGATLLFYEALKKFYGGTWVGGTATLTRTQLSFKPSALNVLLPGKKDTSVTVALNKIANVVLEGGFITKIIRIEMPELTVRLRCYGAAEFMQKIREAAGLGSA